MIITIVCLGLIFLAFSLARKRGQQRIVEKNAAKRNLNEFLSTQAKKRTASLEPEKIEYRHSLIIPSSKVSVPESESESYLSKHKSEKLNPFVTNESLLFTHIDGFNYKIKLSLESYDRGDHYLPSIRITIPMNLNEEVRFTVNLNQNQSIQEARKNIFPLITKEITTGNADFDRNFSIFYEIATNSNIFNEKLQKEFLALATLLKDFKSINVLAQAERNSDIVLTIEDEIAAKAAYGENITRWEIPHNFIAKRRGGKVNHFCVYIDYSKNIDLFEERNFETSLQIVKLFIERLRELNLLVSTF